MWVQPVSGPLVAPTKAPIVPSPSAVHSGTSQPQSLALDRAPPFRNRFSSNARPTSSLEPTACLVGVFLALRSFRPPSDSHNPRIKEINVFAVNEPPRITQSSSSAPISGFECIQSRSCLPETWRDRSGIARCSLRKVVIALRPWRGLR